MRINEVELKQLNEGLGDWLRAGLYNTTGMGGEKGNAAANMYQFTDGFSQQYKQAMNAAKESGMPMNSTGFINSYLNRYGWQATRSQKRALAALANDPKKLAKAMYSIGMSQSRDPQGYVLGRGAGAPAGVQGAQGAKPQQLNKQQLLKALQQAQAQLKKLQSGPQLSSETQGIISGIQRLTGPENLDDLSAVAKTAMQMLYSQDKDKYNELFKEITTGQKAATTPEEQAAAKRVEKLKAAAKAADAESAPFSKVPGATPEPPPRNADEIAARRIAKQKAAMAALNGMTAARQPAAATQAEPAAKPALPTAQPTQADTATAAPSAKPLTAPIKGAGGQEFPTTPSMKPVQVPGARASLNPTEPAKVATKVPAKVARKVPSLTK